MGKKKKSTASTVVVQNQRSDFEDIQPVIDEQIVQTVHSIFEDVINLNALGNIFSDLSATLIEDLKANSLLEYNLELTDDQKLQLRKAIAEKGNEAVEKYLANLNSDGRTKLAYGLVREKTTHLADTLLSSIGNEINRGMIINCHAVAANSKNEKYDEIVLRKYSGSGDITIPTWCILLSSNCVKLFKKSCQTNINGETDPDTENEWDED